MNNITLQATLLGLGFSENEAQVYLASLALGPTTILEIARAAQVKRTTVYDVVERLRQKGLIVIQMNGLKKLYAPEHPQKLSMIAQLQQAQLQQSLPDFEVLYNTQGGDNLIRVYEGLEAVKTVYESLLKALGPKDTYDAIGDHDTWIGIDEDFFTKIKYDFVKKRINTRLLLRDTDKARVLRDNPLSYKVKLFPTDMEITSDVILVPGKVIIHRHLAPTSIIVIENKSVLQTHRQMFEIMWNAVPE